MLLEMVLAAAAAAVPAQDSTGSMASQVTLSPPEMFLAAEVAERQSENSTAVAIYRALSSNPSTEIRNEARFRLALLRMKEGRLTESATLLRTILDEQPEAQRVRLELAGVLATLGDVGSARRELRAARAGDLPPEVARVVDRFSAALREHKPLGGTLSVAMASDSNVNRATQSDTLGTIIGDFVLDEDAKARSGNGLAFDAQGYARTGLGADHAILISLSGSADLYRQKRFNDVAVALRAGPELKIGSGRLNFSGGVARRWFGGEPFTSSAGAAFAYTRPILRVAQVRVTGSTDRVVNHRNRLESGWGFGGSAAVEFSLSSRTGAGLALSGARRSARDPGHSTTAGQLTLFAYREMARMTVTASASVGRLAADERLFLYPQKRSETLLRGTLGATMRQLAVRGFAPTAQLTVERNRSTVEIYDYRRTAFEVGITRAF